jgi:hypothetical protein
MDRHAINQSIEYDLVEDESVHDVESSVRSSQIVPQQMVMPQ